MEDLPSPLLIEILSRVSSSSDLAAARLASKTLTSISLTVSSVVLRCSRRRLLRSRQNLVVPFKTLVLNNLSLLSSTLRYLSIGIEKPFAEEEVAREEEEEEIDDCDDLHLTAVDFLAGLVEIVGRRLKRLEISDYLIQSCWRRSEALAIISDGCESLVHLEVRNAWLSVERLKPMPQLTSLTLEFIQLDDEHLEKMNQCFPSLQVLNLVGVGGLKQPEIRLSQLKLCHWTVSNFPYSLAVHAPNLTELKLQCVEPKILVLETPLLSHLDLKIRKPGLILSPEKIHNLKFVSLVSSYLYSLAHVLQNKSVERIELDVPYPFELDNSFTIMSLVNVFPNIHDLGLGPGAWVKLENSFVNEWIDLRLEWWRLRKLRVHLPLNYDLAFLCFMFNLCAPFSKVILFIHGDVPPAAKNYIISRCKTNFPKILWKWGTYVEKTL